MTAAPAPAPLAPPLGLLAELTHRCPLACPYCSNPIDLERRSAELDTATWLRVFREAAELGVLQLHLSGGEPAARADLVELTRGAVEAGLYTNLITSGIGLDARRLGALAEAGLDHVQLSVQHVREDEADRIAGCRGAHAKKRAFARELAGLGLPLTVNAVIHRHNIDAVEELVAEAVAWGARRIEVAHAQYYGWGLRNRAALLPAAERMAAARATVERLRAALHGTIVIDYVAPDHIGRFPKPCMNGWGRQSMNVNPAGRALPCHAAETIPGLEFWSVRDHPLGAIWRESPAFAAFRGTAWMPEPCASCPRKEIDFGGCRCQALALTGDARNADPVCVHSSAHALVAAAVREAAASDEPFAYRGRPSSRREEAGAVS
ncbi:MAG TPA: pyrroloquinoline quinone biosynthesis protein PqqE [Beijerinckiaceae bacterium]|jgi:pyrroloquinoline quinone biosynthesis protein E